MTQIPSKEEIEQFINALQLSIKSKIENWKLSKNSPKKWLIISFLISENDENLNLFRSLIENERGVGTKDMFVNKKFKGLFILLDKITPQLTQFLLLTRLEKEKMIKLSELDPQYEPFIQAMHPTSSSKRKNNTFINQVSDASKIIFEELEKKEMTLRVLAEKTALTPMALSKIKRGGDLRLSSLLKICQALGLNLKLEE